MDAKRIIVVGAGPAGMMAAIRAAELTRPVFLLEKNSCPGQKLLLSGKGRCNLTNTCDLDSFIERFSGNGQFLRDTFKRFFYPELMRFFETRGLRLNVERQLRVFPATNKASSILEVLKRELSTPTIKVSYNTCVRDVLAVRGKTKGVVLTDGTVMTAEKVILATGGMSYSFTGSTGDGLRIAQKIGHHIVTPRPGLVPLVTKEKYPARLTGLTLKNVRLKFSDSQKELLSPVGEVSFTAHGISGPLVFSLSGRVADWLAQGKTVFADIDLKPALSKEQLDDRLLREIALHSRKNLNAILKELLPSALIVTFIDIVKADPQKKANQITQKERSSLIHLLKEFRLTIAASEPLEKAMITRGGVSLKDIDPRTMESRLIKGLFFAGEVIDVDADTGGFNLQAAFSTGYLAGESAAH